MCPPVSPHEGAFIDKCTNMFWCEHASFMNGNAAFAGGDVPFADGNAPAGRHGRAHRHRPYHFSYGSCHKIAGEVLADGQTQEMIAGRGI